MLSSMRRRRMWSNWISDKRWKRTWWAWPETWRSCERSWRMQRSDNASILEVLQANECQMHCNFAWSEKVQMVLRVRDWIEVGHVCIFIVARMVAWLISGVEWDPLNCLLACMHAAGTGSYNGIFPTSDLSYNALQQQVFGTDNYGLHSQVPRLLSFALLLFLFFFPLLPFTARVHSRFLLLP